MATLVTRVRKRNNFKLSVTSTINTGTLSGEAVKTCAPGAGTAIGANCDFRPAQPFSIS